MPTLPCDAQVISLQWLLRSDGWDILDRTRGRADGSVMPGPVGPNPSLTIAALADRFADRILEQHRR